MNSRLLAIIRKEFIQAFRDRRTVIIILIMPVMQLFLLGYAATTDVKNIAIGVWDQNQTPQSRALLDAFRAADYFQIAYTVSSQDEMQQLIEKGSARAVLIIPPDYDRHLLEGDAQVSMILDGSDASVGSTALSVSQLIGQAYGTKVVQSQAALSGRINGTGAPLQVRTRVWYNPDLLSAYFMIPGVIGQILFMITTILTATAIVRERERGTIEQLIVTPIRPWELMVGKIIPYIILAAVEAASPAAWGDVVLARKETPTSYHLSVVVDDALQGVTQVVRGQDLFWSTSVHRLLQALLGLPAPTYHHHRLVLGPDGRKLSKSTQATALRTLRQAGAKAADIREMVGLR